MRIVEGENELTLQYRIFSIKHRGRLFKSRPRRPGAYSNRAFIRARRLFIKCIFHPSIFYHQYWRFIELRTKRETMSPALSHLRESGMSFIKKTSLTGTVIELFSTFYFSVKHGASVSATAPQQTYCASNSEQGGGEPEVPAPSVVRKANHGGIQGSFKRWRNPLDDSCLMDRPTEIEIGMIPDVWCVVCFICFS